MQLPLKHRTERHQIEVDLVGDLVSLYASSPRDDEHDGVAVELTADAAIMIARALVSAAHRIRYQHEK